MDNKVEFVLICGTGRCGTNIVKEVFSVHSSVITLPFEQRFINDPDGIIDFYNSFSASWSPYIADRKIKRLEALLRRMSYQSPFESVAGSIVGRLDGQGKYLSLQSITGGNWMIGSPIFRNILDGFYQNL